MSWGGDGGGSSSSPPASISPPGGVFTGGGSATGSTSAPSGGVVGGGSTAITTSSSTTSSLPASKLYNRAAAVKWAIDNYNATPTFSDDDCTYYVSQALWAGGLNKTWDWTNQEWNPWNLAKRSWGLGSPSQTAADAEYLYEYLQDNKLATKRKVTWSDNTVQGAQAGDVIAYDWDGGSDGSIDHLVLVTKVDSTGVYVSQHSPPRDNKFWSWDPTINNWVQYIPIKKGNGPSIAYLLHITY